MHELKVALFGPQITHWTAERLSDIQTALLHDTDVGFLRQTLLEIPSLWNLLEREFEVETGFSGPDQLRGLQQFAEGTLNLNPQKLSNTQLAPLSIISQTLEFIRNAPKHDLMGFQAAQGFCIGFLSAAALSSAKDWGKFEANICNAVRLAACIGYIVDSHEASMDEEDRATAISIRWKTRADKAQIQSCLDLFPEAYISCFTDENAFTVTLPQSICTAFQERIAESNVTISVVGIHGNYHFPNHSAAANILSRICSQNRSLLGLPDAEDLHLPLRSTVDATLITTGALHDIAIELILWKQAHWFKTVKSALDDVPLDRISILPLGGKGATIPRSLQSAVNFSTLASNNEDEHSQREEIAVIGMACRFPRAESLAAFWELLNQGETAFGPLPSGRFSPANVAREPKLSNVRGNFLDRPSPDMFDHRFFSISGREAKSMDPQQRLALEVSYEALENSHYFRNATPCPDVGCYLGVGAVDYEHNIASEAANSFAAVGTLRAFISGRISHFFGWEGPSITFDTACSSSAVAIHTACRAVLGDECSMAIAGGVNVITSPNLHQNLAAASFLHPEGGPSRAFDVNARGYCRGEGAGIIVLKKLSQALADGDDILGVIASSAINQGSNSSSITVPDSVSQSSLYRRVLSSAGISPKNVGYVEAHGTGTPVGDPVEYESVSLAFTDCGRHDPVLLGSVKDNIGHTEAASGVAGVIKVLLMLQHNTVPKQANFDSLNPKIRPCQEIVIPKDTQIWAPERQYASLVNNYGAAGSNAAILLRPHTRKGTLSAKGLPTRTRDTYPILLSAKTPSHLQAYMDVLKSYLSGSKASLGSIAYGLARTRNVSFGYRTAFTASDATNGVSILSKKIESLAPKTSLPGVLCFGGQTGRVVNISRSLYNSCGLFRKHLDHCDAICQELCLPSIYPQIFSGEVIEDLVSLHCMLLSLQISSARCWIESGFEVKTLIGHSFGQLSALCVAGSISVKDTFRLVSSRARLIRQNWGLDGGAMLSVECDRVDVDAVVDAVSTVNHDLRIEIACYNGPRSFVIAGPELSITKSREEFQKRSIKTNLLSNSHAYHSYLADGILQELAVVAGSINIQTPRIHVETCSAEGSWQSFTAEEVTQHTRQPVYFGEAVERLAARLPSAVWLEAGSNTPIMSMVRRVLAKKVRSDVFIPMDLGKVEAISEVAEAVCRLWKAGSATQFWSFHPDSDPNSHYQVLNLPPYQFDRSTHWIQLKTSPTYIESSSTDGNLLNLVGQTVPGEYLFSVDTTQPAFVLASRGHAVTGHSLCPASMYIELAALAARSVTESGIEKESPGRIPHITGLRMTAPLALGASSPVFIRLNQTSANSWKFVLFSRRSNIPNTRDEGVISEHAKGGITWSLPDVTRAGSTLQLLQKFGGQGIKRLSSTPATTAISGTMVYRLFSEVVTYADYYQGVRSVSASGTEALGLVKVPAQLITQPHGVCEPIILDNFLQVAGIHVNCLSHRDNDQVYMCTAVEEVVFTSSFMTNKADARQWSVYTRYDLSDSKMEMDNDIFVCEEPSGTLVLAILGATFHRVAFKSLAKALARLGHENVHNSERSLLDRASSLSTGLNESHLIQDDSGYQTSSSSSPLGEKHISIDKDVTRSDDLRVLPDDLPVKSSEKGESLRLVSTLFSAIIGIPVEDITANLTLDELGVDSLLVGEILFEFKQRYNITISQPDFLGCNDVLAVSNLLSADVVADPQDEELCQNSSVTTVDKAANDRAEASKPAYVEQIGEGNRPNVALVSSKCFSTANRSYHIHAKTTGFVNFYRDVFPLQSQLVVRYVVEAFATLGCDLETLQAGTQVPTISADARHDQLVPQLYRILRDDGLLKEFDGAFYRTEIPVVSSSAGTLHQSMLAEFPKHKSETQLLHTTGSKLADCLSGRADPIALLFQNAAARSVLEDVYTNAPMFKTGTLVLDQLLTSVLEHVSNSTSTSNGRGLRILELGAGTGGTSKHIIEKLAGLGCSFSYTFTDLSPSLVAAAKRKFAKWSDFMLFTTLDIEKEPAVQFLNSYDIIISTNCIHATRNLVKSTTHIRKMLRADGILCLVELTRNLYWFDLVFGLLEGWWLFDDGRVHALAHEQTWDRSLRAAGFKWVDWTASDLPESDILRLITASPCGIEEGKKAEDELPRKESLTFKEVDGLNLQADIYYPPAKVAEGDRLPIAIMIHGGGHIMLSRNDIRPQQTDALLSNGFLPISFDYRLCPETTLLEGPMVDVVDALAWVRRELPGVELQRRDIADAIDATRVVAVGWSSGGHLALTLAWMSVPRGIEPPSAIFALYCATDFEDPFWTRPNLAPGADHDGNIYEIDEEIWINGIMETPIASYNVPKQKRALGGWLAPSDPRSRLALYMNTKGRTLDILLGGLDKRTRKGFKKNPLNTETLQAVSPLAQINKGKYNVPTFLVHPRLDDLIPWEQSERSIKALQSRGVDAELRIIDGGAPHLFDMYPHGKGYEIGMDAVRAGYSFLAKHVGKTWEQSM
ncbi:Conidial yellow pigment biosynthesis polyketide synthase [Cytospora mali]|uniref:Conidial yellow pigment biosynthesis polyketide synthase n=1 Tax=Cytospora mali TaxID=578113 RepID=A0A194WC51_CYTMA|nr:Conidial yellow pigment biosynthesis polyketide synthase [Valsa mali]